MRNWILKAAIAGALSLVPQTLAQGLIWKFLQPWSPPRGAHESRVQSCQNPQPLNQIAVDDWICGATGPLLRLHWWGTLNTPLQSTRPFYVAIYAHTPGSCQPTFTQRLYQTCLVPDYRKYVGTDCQQRRVYRMSGVLSVPFTQVQGTHYWLQISEADAESVQPGIENFRWSGHLPIQNCEAASAFPFVQPLRDPCNQQPVDLSFGWSSRDISGTVVVPAGTLIPGTLQLNIFDTAGTLRETLAVEPDDNGHWNASPEIEDGMYIVEIRGTGMLPKREPVQFDNGVCSMMSFFDVFYGDLDGDNQIALSDLTIQLSNFGRTVSP